MNDNILVSIITVSYNSANTILETIKSVKNQKYKYIQHVFIDGNSSDKTVSLIKKNLKDGDLLLSENDDGIYHAMNKGISLSKGKIISILNSDDVFSDDLVISTIVKNFKNNIDIIYGDLHYVSKNTNKVLRRWISSSYMNNSFSRGWHPPHPSFFVKKTVYDNYGYFDTNLKIASDFDIMYRFLEFHKLNSLYINKVFVNMKVGGKSNNSIKNIYLGNMEILSIFKKYGINKTILFTIKRLIFKLGQYKL